MITKKIKENERNKSNKERQINRRTERKKERKKLKKEKEKQQQHKHKTKKQSWLDVPFLSNGLGTVGYWFLSKWKATFLDN